MAAPPQKAVGRQTSCEAEMFHSLCMFLESLHMKKKEDKLHALERYLSRFALSCDLFPLMRLLLPGIDHDRSTYKLKELALAKLYGEVFALPDAQKRRLLHWKDPAMQEGYKCAAGDFPSVLYSVVEARATVKPGTSTLTIADVNAALDGIHNAGDNDTKRKQLLELIRRASACEQKWLVKVILKDIKVGFSHESVLKRFHPDAMDIYNRTSMLRQVLDEIRLQYQRGESGVVAGSVAVKEESEAPSSVGPRWASAERILFSKFKPMLSQRLLLDQLDALMDGSKSFFVEAKYDGERMLAHIDRDTRRLELYTRNAIDYTSVYAPTMRKILLEGLLGRQAVLDGEMLAWDEKEQAFVPFGNNRSVATAGDPNRHLCFVVFDILFFTDPDGLVYDLRRTRLEARRELLARAISPKEHWLEVSPAIVTTNPSDVQSRLEGIMDFRQEGIVLKDVTSTYWLNARKRGWYKVKPEYDGISETLDLLVVGAFFGDSQKRRGGQGLSADLADNCAQFLLAALKGNGKEGDDVVTVGRVGTGFSMQELQEIRDKIRPHLRRYDAHRAPPWLGGWRGSGKAKPDAILDAPSNGFVMEIRAAEIIPSDDYEFGHTLRFPRAVVAMRTDKDWNDACTQAELTEFLAAGGRGQLSSRRVRGKVEVRSEGEEESDADFASPAKKKRRNKGAGAAGASRSAFWRAHSGGVLEGFQEADTTHVPVASRLLEGAEIFVVNGDAEHTKADLEAYVVRHGGRNVQNYIRGRTSLVIAASMNGLRARNLAQTAQVDIVAYTYMFQCENAGKMLPLRPCHLLHQSPEMKERLSGAFDRFGDAYFEEATVVSLRDVLAGIPDAAAAEVKSNVFHALARHPRLRSPFLRSNEPVRAAAVDASPQAATLPASSAPAPTRIEGGFFDRNWF